MWHFLTLFHQKLVRGQVVIHINNMFPKTFANGSSRNYDWYRGLVKYVEVAAISTTLFTYVTVRVSLSLLIVHYIPPWNLVFEALVQWVQTVKPPVVKDITSSRETLPEIKVDVDNKVPSKTILFVATLMSVLAFSVVIGGIFIIYINK